MTAATQEKARVAVELRRAGFTAAEIAGVLGVSRSRASELYCDPDRSRARARRNSYRGTCEVCGKPTDGSAGRDKAPKRCAAHRKERETLWTEAILIERIQEWASLYGQPPRMSDWNPHKARAEGDDWRAERFLGDDRWPWFTSVVRRFGSWNAGIRAAGFEPRRALNPHVAERVAA